MKQASEALRPLLTHLECTALQKLKDANPLTAPMCYAGTSNVRRYYENIRLPERLLVIGDSAAAFNPVSID